MIVKVTIDMIYMFDSLYVNLLGFRRVKKVGGNEPWILCIRHCIRECGTLDYRAGAEERLLMYLLFITTPARRAFEIERMAGGYFLDFMTLHLVVPRAPASGLRKDERSKSAIAID